MGLIRHTNTPGTRCYSTYCGDPVQAETERRRRKTMKSNESHAKNNTTRHDTTPRVRLGLEHFRVFKLKTTIKHVCLGVLRVTPVEKGHRCQQLLPGGVDYEETEAALPGDAAAGLTVRR